jgi:hypothetical protein
MGERLLVGQRNPEFLTTDFTDDHRSLILLVVVVVTVLGFSL